MKKKKINIVRRICFLSILMCVNMVHVKASEDTYLISLFVPLKSMYKVFYCLHFSMAGDILKKIKKKSIESNGVADFLFFVLLLLWIHPLACCKNWWTMSFCLPVCVCVCVDGRLSVCNLRGLLWILVDDRLIICLPTIDSNGPKKIIQIFDL